MSIGSKIADRRKELKMTQQELAEALNVSFQAVSSWEREEYLPETEKIQLIANALSIKVSELFEEDTVDASMWKFEDEIFSVEHMQRKVKDYARAKGYMETLKSLKIMTKYHEGQFRKSKKGEKVPYIVHPLTLACHAIALGIAEDDLLAACLLHDVLEDCDVTRAELDINENILDAVELVSFEDIDGLSHEESKEKYYKKISGNKIASMVKILDRCNNISMMAAAFSKTKMAEYINETEKYILPILTIVKHEYDDYYNAAFLIKYQMLSVMETLKRTL